MYNSKTNNENISILSPIMDNFDYSAKKSDEIPRDINKEQVKILNIVQWDSQV